MDAEKLKEMPRSARRQIERERAAAAPKIKAEAVKAVEELNTFVKSLIRKHQDAYNAFLETAPTSPLVKVAYLFSVGETTSDEKELRMGLSNVPEELFQTAARSAENPSSIKIMYLRIDKVSTLKPDHNLPPHETHQETLTGNDLQQLVYHAAVILKNNVQDMEMEILAAKNRLMEDLVVHLVGSGIQYQEMQNAKMADQENRKQQKDIKEKVAEVNKVFDQAAEMKIN